MLEVSGLGVTYGAVHAVQDLTFTVREGTVVVLLGANGAGKSSTLKAVSGLVRPAAGTLRYEGEDITRWSAQRRVGAGIAHVMEGRRLFGDQTVHQNLELGAWLRRRRRAASPAAIAADIEDKYERFPVLRERRNQFASTLSGGEQQMLTISTALMSRPRLLLLDEPSLGLAPKIIAHVFDAIRRLREQGVTILWVEQMATQALQLADQAYVLAQGRLVDEGTGKDLLGRPSALKRAYLATGG